MICITYTYLCRGTLRRFSAQAVPVYRPQLMRFSCLVMGTMGMAEIGPWYLIERWMRITMPRSSPRYWDAVEISPCFSFLLPLAAERRRLHMQNVSHDAILILPDSCRVWNFLYRRRALLMITLSFIFESVERWLTPSQKAAMMRYWWTFATLYFARAICPAAFFIDDMNNNMLPDIPGLLPCR